jgi:subtilase-type serine protease
MQGTSMASPVTAGAAVLVREAFPYMTARQIIQVMLTTTNRSGLWADESIYGRGLLDLGKAIDGPGEFGGEGFAPIFSVDTQGYDSVWRNDAAASDLLHVTGRADILGGVLELDGLQTHHVNQSFTFLQADGGVTLGPTY